MPAPQRASRWCCWRPIGSGPAAVAGIGTVAADGADSFRALEQLSGRRVARAHFDLTRKAVLDLSATVKRLRLRADFEVGDAVRIVPAGADPGPWVREAGARAEAGLDGRWVKPSSAAQASGIADTRGGLRLSRWATCHPYRLVTGFAAAAAGRGAALHERSPVTRVTFTRTEARVVTAGGVITTRAVLHCTGEPTALAGALRRHVRPMTRGLALTAPLGSAMRKAVGVVPAVVTDVHDPPHVVRWMEGPAALVAGADAPRPRAARPPGLDIQRTDNSCTAVAAVSGDLRDPAGLRLVDAARPDAGRRPGGRPHRNFPISCSPSAPGTTRRGRSSPAACCCATCAASRPLTTNGLDSPASCRSPALPSAATGVLGAGAKPPPLRRRLVKAWPAVPSSPGDIYCEVDPF